MTDQQGVVNLSKIRVGMANKGKKTNPWFAFNSHTLIFVLL